MTKSEKIVILLVRKALNRNYCIDPKDFSNVDWADVVNLSMAHGVGAIAFDGVEYLPSDCRPDRSNLMYWLGQTVCQETQYEHNWLVACQLADLWTESEIKAIILKGRSIAQYYPKPNHRYSCDFDVFIQENWCKACDLLEAKGINLSREVYKEVEFTLDGVYVECHKYITPLRGNDTLIRFERYLRSLLDCDKISYFEGSKLIAPPLMFTVMLYIEHALGDFLHGKLSLKHIVDWILLREQNVDWITFTIRCAEFKFDRFVFLLNELADIIEGKKECDPTSGRYNYILDKIFKKSTEKKGKQSWFQRRVGLFFEIIKNRRLYSQFGYCSMTNFLFHSMWTHFFKKDVNF